VRELAAQINRDYQGKALHVTGILENCFMFMADLLRGLKVPVVCHFMKVETRDRPLDGIDLRELIYSPKVDVAGKDVLLVDGIVQSGVVQDHLFRYLVGRGPASLRTATLVEKTRERKVAVATQYMAFKTSARFLVGYGLGHEERYRNLPYLAMLP
jgi:hypoxanthine phosphoribosyltransferase